jgi:hypothetical protein
METHSLETPIGDFRRGKPLTPTQSSPVAWMSRHTRHAGKVSFSEQVGRDNNVAPFASVPSFDAGSNDQTPGSTINRPHSHS